MIELNKVKSNINESFFKQYRVYKIKCDSSLWGHMDSLLDTVEASCGKKEEGVTYLYVLTKDNRAALKQALEKAQLDYYIVSETRTVPLKLLVNAVCRDENFMSIGGRNFYLSTVQFYKEDKSLRSVVDIPEIWASNEGCITIHNVRFKRYREGASGPFYRLASGKLVRTLRPDETNCFVIGGLKGKHAGPLPILAIYEADYIGSRAAIVRTVVGKINDRFQGLLRLDFETAEDCMHIGDKTIGTYRKKVDQMIERQFQGIGVKSDIPEVYENYRVPKGDRYRIELIDAKEDYEDDEDADPYQPRLDTQHITRETYEAVVGKKEINAIVRACMVELAIKKDIHERRDSFNTSNENLICIVRDEKTKRFTYCEKKNTGELVFGEFIEFGEHPDFVRERLFEVKEDYILIKGENMYGIKETEYVPLPSADLLSETIDKKGKIRNTEDRNRLIGGMLDMHLYRYQGRTFYYSASIGGGMNTKIAKASRLMEIVDYSTEGTNKNFDWLFDYLGVTYINAGNRFTKHPYLFKYLKEWQTVEGTQE